MQIMGLAVAFDRLRYKLRISNITSRVIEDHRGGALMVTYVDGLTNVILRTDVIMGSQTAARKRLEKSLQELWREGDTFKLIVDRGLNGVGYRIIRLH